MDKVTEWLVDKFQHPLSPLFFFLGAMLILLGVSTGVSVPLLNQIVLDANFRWVALIIGSIFCFLAIVIYYRPPRVDKKSETSLADNALPEELRLSFSGRRAALSENQSSILNFIVSHCYTGNHVSQDVLEKKFSQYSRTELIYRLEYLRLLGFINKQNLSQADGGDYYSYFLTNDYKKDLGDATVFRGAAVAQNVGAIGTSYRSRDTFGRRKKG